MKSKRVVNAVISCLVYSQVFVPNQNCFLPQYQYSIVVVKCHYIIIVMKTNLNKVNYHRAVGHSAITMVS